MRFIKYPILRLIVVFSIGFFLGLGLILLYFKIKPPLNSAKPNSAQSAQQEDIYLNFLQEVYDKIKENYWESLNDAVLVNIFKLRTEALVGTQYNLKSNDKEGLELMLKEVLKEIPEDRKEEFVTKLTSLVLNSLQPAGRNQLYSEKEARDLENRVQNINPQANLYENLGVKEEASQKEIESAYEQKLTQLSLEKQKNPEKKEEIEQEIKKLNYTFDVLSDPYKREQYNKSKIEPSGFYKLLTPDIAYIYIQKITPTSFEEFQRVAQKIDEDEKADPHTLILDLRNNVGGAIDILPFFLGPFIGPNQYAYEFFRRGEYIPYKTKTGWLPSLVRYKAVVVLINENTQSSAELMASVLKKYNVGVLVGTRTRGWGTIEKVFQLENQINPDKKYSLFLVHTITLREDGQPIEGNGVEPLINIKDPQWEKMLMWHFHYPELVEKVKEVWNKNPLDVVF